MSNDRIRQKMKAAGKKLRDIIRERNWYAYGKVGAKDKNEKTNIYSA